MISHTQRTLVISVDTVLDQYMQLKSIEALYIQKEKQTNTPHQSTEHATQENTRRRDKQQAVGNKNGATDTRDEE